MPLHFHRNEIAGPQLTATGDTLTFRSMRDDLVGLRATAPAGIVDTAVTSIGNSEQGNPIYAIRFGKNSGMPVLIVGCHHAREWISVEMPYLIAEYLINNYSRDALVRRIVDSLDIWVVPLLNPDGHERSVLVDRLWRKNFPTDPARESVDPNRNYGTSTWGTALGAFSTNPASDIYRGKSGGYAAEVQAMQTLITTRQFKGTLDYHAFGRFVLFPWSGRTVPHPDGDQDGMASHIERVVDLRSVDYQRLQASTLYPTIWGVTPEEGKVPGGMMDYVVENVPDSIAITVELEPELSDPRGFVLPESEIQFTFDLHRASILTFLNCIGTIKNPPPVRQLVLAAGTSNNLIVFNPDCTRAFEAY